MIVYLENKFDGVNMTSNVTNSQSSQHRELTDNEFKQLCKGAKKFVSEYKRLQGQIQLDKEERLVQAFYESIGLEVPNLNKTDAIHKIYRKYLEDAIEEKIIGQTFELSLKKLDPYFAFYKKHKECKTFDIQQFTEAPNLKPLFELATKSQIELIVINQAVTNKMTAEEYYALKDAKTANRTLQFHIAVNADANTNVKPSSKNSAPATSPIVSRPATSSHSPNTSPTSSPTHPSVMATRYSPPRSPEANKPASGSPPTKGFAIPSKSQKDNVSTSTTQNTPQTFDVKKLTQEDYDKVKGYIESKFISLKNNLIKNAHEPNEIYQNLSYRPFFEVLVEYFANNVNTTLPETLSYVEDLLKTRGLRINNKIRILK